MASRRLSHAFFVQYHVEMRKNAKRKALKRMIDNYVVSFFCFSLFCRNFAIQREQLHQLMAFCHHFEQHCPLCWCALL